MPRRRFYNLFIAPRQTNEDMRNREVVLNVLLTGTLGMLGLVFLLLLFSWTVAGYHYVLSRLLLVLPIVAIVGSLYGLSRRGYYRTAASYLVAIYFLLAAAMVYRWGVTLPTAELLNGLVIVLAGTLLGPTYSLYAAGSASIVLVACEIATTHKLIHPNLSWTVLPPNMTDVLGFCVIFAVIALVSWLFNQQMERSLHKAERAEAALTKQKALLETTVVERTSELQAVQLEKIQQMYRFAELGQLSTALLHDLANHLTTLTLDIEGLEAQSRSRMLQRAKRSIHYMDDMVLRVRDQLYGRSHRRQFSIATEIEEVVHILGHRAREAKVSLAWQALSDRKTLRCSGEPVKFRQLIANLISNAVDAYDGHESELKREVMVTAENTKHEIIVRVHDWGKGIPDATRQQLFEAFYSTKKTGMGMGLFIAKQIAEEHFHGGLTIDLKEAHTVFVLRLKKSES